MGGMEEVLRIDVVLDRMETVRGTGGEVTMILFHVTWEKVRFCQGV